MSEYKDLKNNTRKIIEWTLTEKSKGARLREEVIDELYRIFEKK